MSGNRILWGQITLVLAVVLATTWTATQWTAWRLGFQPQLGQPWFGLAQSIPVYYPPAFFWWWYAYDAYAPSVFIEGAFIAASGGFIAVALAIALSILRAHEAKNVETYGSVRWATKEEIRAAGLLGPDGVSSAAMQNTICAMTDRNTFCALHRQDRVKASAWWSRRC
jgi:type IV secretion system protein VirD4